MFSKFLLKIMREYKTIRHSWTDHRWQYSMARALCMLDNQCYRHTEYVILLFHGNIGYTNARQCYLFISLTDV